MRRRVLTAALAAAVALALTLLAGTGVLTSADLRLSDRLYLSREASDGEIVIVGIDDRAIDELGPYNQWGRDVVASAIDALNASDDCRPAVIAVDVLYTGLSDEYADEWLAEAAGQYGNVIVAARAIYGSMLVDDGDGDYILESDAVVGFESPYDALNDAAVIGTINSMFDRDGLLRQHLLEVTLPSGEVVPSMALAAANMYRDYIGEDGVALPPTDSRGFWRLPFCGVPGDFDESISIVDVISGDIEPEFFADRIVLIGPYTVGLQDSYLTAADHARPMYGVEYQANAIQALLWGSYQREVGDLPQLVVLFVLLVVVFYAFRRRKVWLSTLLWLAICGAYIGTAKLCYTYGYILHLLWIPVGVTVVYAGWIAANYVVAAREKRFVTGVFGRYVDPSVIRELLKEGSDNLGLGGKMCDIAVLFVDIRGFTSMSEVLTPPEVVEILNRYLSLTTDCVMKNHGTLDKFVGDCTMAFWNAPLEQDDYVMHACQAAMDMVTGSRELEKQLLERYGRTVTFGVGVHVGPAVVGNIGATMRMDYTAIGDTVNTASRLESNAPGGTIYISRAVVDSLGDRISATPLATPIKLKGKADGFEIFTLDEVRE